MFRRPPRLNYYAPDVRPGLIFRRLIDVDCTRIFLCYVTFFDKWRKLSNWSGVVILVSVLFNLITPLVMWNVVLVEAVSLSRVKCDSSSSRTLNVLGYSLPTLCSSNCCRRLRRVRFGSPYFTTTRYYVELK